MAVAILHTQNFIRFHQFVLKILNGNTILTLNKGHIEKTKRNIICNFTYLHFVNINAFTKFYQNPSIGPQDIEHKRIFDINRGP